MNCSSTRSKIFLAAAISASCCACPATRTAAGLDAGLDAEILAAPNAGAPTDASASLDAATADAARADAGAADGGFKALEFSASWLTDAGAHALSAKESNLEIAPEAWFEIDSQRLADVRIRLFDDSDKVVASSDKLESSDRTRYRLAPAELLQPGSRYFLVIDGQKDDQPTDSAGVAYEQVRLELQTAGQKPVVEKKASKKKKKR